MKYAVLFGLLLLAACDNGRSVVFVSTKSEQNQTTNIPNYLTYCPKVDVKIDPLPAIRTAKELADYANRLETAREKLESALQLCDMRRQQLLVKLRAG